MIRFFVYCCMAIMITSCSPYRWISKSLHDEQNNIQHHVGFYLYDPDTKQVLSNVNGDHYFTPASNTKIFTLFGAVALLGDSLSALKYTQHDDTTIFWGMGDPTFLNDKFTQQPTLHFFEKVSGTLYFSTSNWNDTKYFGPGWSWDDYSYAYSAERSPFPMYGNLMNIEKTDADWMIRPNYFNNIIFDTTHTAKKEKLLRLPADNKLVYYKGDRRANASFNIPYHWNNRLITELLADTLHRKVFWTDQPMPPDAQTFKSIAVDSVYAVMMKESDNFIAEQLLLQCAAQVSDTLNPDIAIRYIKTNYLKDMPDSIVWVDGSGLSRYNLFTPRTIVSLWEKIETIVPREKLLSWLAVGGKSGTLKNYYHNDTPYIFGKTGTLSNNHCLSGYLITKKGRVLLFSFMNNNYTTSSGKIKVYMEKVLKSIYEKY